MAKTITVPKLSALKGKLASPKAKIYLVAALVVVLLALFLWKNKSLVIVATVNGQPIPRWTLEKRLVGRYGTQTLEEVVNEEIILQAGQKKNIQVSEAEIDSKVAEIDSSLGGKISLKDALAGQGLSMDEFRMQIKLQLTLEKLAGASIVVSDKDVTAYLDKNRSSMTATDEAGLKLEAQKTLEAQKKNEALRQLFNDLKNQAKVVRYL